MSQLTADEQFMLELINRARLDLVKEADLYLGFDTFRPPQAVAAS
jgi:hypothetical protein